MLGIKQNKGITIINQTAAGFQDVVNELDYGIKLCREKKSENDVKIGCLNSENQELTEKIQEAEHFRTNLVSMLNPKNDSGSQSQRR